MSVNEKMTAIADAIRDKTGGTDLLTLDGMAAGVEQVYDAGKQAEYDRFWDDLQQNGKRTYYPNFFGGSWTKEFFNPKYPVEPTMAREIFYKTRINLDESYEGRISFHKATDMNSAFSTYQGGDTIGITIDASAATDIGGLFNSSSKVVTIKKVIFGNKVTNWPTPFKNCTKLANIVVEGFIDFNVSFQWCPLTAASAKSIILCLEDLTGYTYHAPRTITFSETTWSYLDAEGEASPAGTTWREYISLLGWDT